VPLHAVLTDQRANLMDEITKRVNVKTMELGVETVDVRIKRADLPQANSQSVYNRMKTDREREAGQLRAEGDEENARIKATADREVAVIKADAGLKGQILKVRPGPVVTLYELEPAPGIKSSRVISLADAKAQAFAECAKAGKSCTLSDTFVGDSGHYFSAEVAYPTGEYRRVSVGSSKVSNQ